MLESEFKSEFLLRVRKRFLNLDIDHIDVKSTTRRSFPDTILLGPNHKWAALEFKKHSRARRQPNQEYTIERLNTKGFARFVYPTNSEEILNELETLFTSE